MTKDMEENEVSVQLKNELMHLENCYIYKDTTTKSSLKRHTHITKINILKGHYNCAFRDGSEIVTLNRSNYIKSMTELISDLLLNYKKLII